MSASSDQRIAVLLKASELAADQCKQARTLLDDDTQGDFAGISADTLALLLAINSERVISHNA